MNQSDFEIAENNFRIIANSAPFALWLSGLDKKCCYFNKAWLEFTGRTMDQEVGVGWAEGVHPEDVENCLNIYVSFFNERKPFKMEYRLKRYDGAYRWVLDTGSPRFAPSGDFLGYCGSCIDVTDMWFAHHEMVTYSKQQNEVIKCTNELLNLYKQPYSSNSTNNNLTNNISNDEDSKFFENILKSATISTGSNMAVIFKFNPENTYEIIMESSWNLPMQDSTNGTNSNGNVNLNGNGVNHQRIKRNQVMFTLPNDFWDEVIKQHQYHKQQQHEISIGNIIYSILTCRYFTPFLVSFGAKSSTTVTILGSGSTGTPSSSSPSSSIEDIEEGNSRPYGYICVANVGEKEFTAIEQNTLVCMSNVITLYVHKNQEAHYSRIKDSISSTIAKTSSNAIITVDSFGKLLDLNPKAIDILKLDTFELSKTYISNYFKFLNNNSNSSNSNHNLNGNRQEDFYKILNNYLTNNNLYEIFFETTCWINNNSKPMGISVELFIKEVRLNGFTSIFLFIFKDSKSHLEKLEMLAKKSVQENLEKTLFLSRLSHEIRNPLNCIINMSEILLDTSYSIEQKDILETINMAGNNLRTLIDDVLDISKIESGKLEIKNEPFKIRECLEQSLSMVSLSAQKKGVELALLLDSSVPEYIVADHSKLIEVLINTIGNGVKFTDHGSVVVTVYAKYLNNTTINESFEDHNSNNTLSPILNSNHNSNSNINNNNNNDSDSDSNSNSSDSDSLPKQVITNQQIILQQQYPQQQIIEIYFIVRDKGIGIAAGEIDKLFNNFTQVHLNSSQYGGTGLGLAISKKIIELMGGSIQVESEYGKGTKVSFSIISSVLPPIYNTQVLQPNNFNNPIVNSNGLPQISNPTSTNSTSMISIPQNATTNTSNNSIEHRAFKTGTNPVQRRKSLLDICFDKKILIIAKDEDVRSMITSYAKLMLFHINSFESIMKEEEVLNILNIGGDKFDLIMIDYPYGCNDNEFKTILQMFTSHVNYHKLILMIPMTFVQHVFYSDLIDSFITKPLKLSSFEETVLKLLTNNNNNNNNNINNTNGLSQSGNSITTNSITASLQSLPSISSPISPPLSNHNHNHNHNNNNNSHHHHHHSNSTSSPNSLKSATLYDNTMAQKLPLSILSTEDNQVNQKVINLIFSKLGYTIDQAGNGVIALDMISKKKYDFVFLDIEMPIMGGLACARTICSRYGMDSRPNLIALTGRALPEQIQECKDSGMIDYLVKPLKVNRIIEVLKKYNPPKFYHIDQI